MTEKINLQNISFFEFHKSQYNPELYYQTGRDDAINQLMSIAPDQAMEMANELLGGHLQGPEGYFCRIVAVDEKYYGPDLVCFLVCLGYLFTQQGRYFVRDVEDPESPAIYIGEEEGSRVSLPHCDVELIPLPQKVMRLASDTLLIYLQVGGGEQMLLLDKEHLDPQIIAQLPDVLDMPVRQERGGIYPNVRIHEDGMLKNYSSEVLTRIAHDGHAASKEILTVVEYINSHSSWFPLAEEIQPGMLMGWNNRRFLHRVTVDESLVRERLRFHFRILLQSRAVAF